MSISSTIEEAVAALRRGQAVIFPTDTVYGLGMAVDFATGPEALFQLKRRPESKPVGWLVAGQDALDRYACGVPDYAREWAAMHWPGGLTLIVRASAAVPPAFCSAEGTVGLRMPANDMALELIRRAGCPLATTSANISGEPAVSEFSQIGAELLAAVPAALRDVCPKTGIASTVVDCSGAAPRILRQGDVVLPAIAPASSCALREGHPQRRS